MTIPHPVNGIQDEAQHWVRLTVNTVNTTEQIADLAMSQQDRPARIARPESSPTWWAMLRAVSVPPGPC
jgi:hypothetical protein